MARVGAASNLLGPHPPPRHGVAPTQMLLGADEGHVWCCGSAKAPLAPGSPTPPPPIASPVW